MLSEYPDDDLDPGADADTTDSDTDVAVRRPTLPGPAAAATGPLPTTIHSATPGKSAPR